MTIGGAGNDWSFVDSTDSAPAFTGPPVVMSPATSGSGPYAQSTVLSSWSPEPAANLPIIYGQYSAQGANGIAQAVAAQQQMGFSGANTMYGNPSVQNTSPVMAPPRSTAPVTSQAVPVAAAADEDDAETVTEAAPAAAPAPAPASASAAAPAAVRRPATKPKATANKPVARKSDDKDDDKKVTVKSGDTLSAIAKRHGTTADRLYELNKKVIGGNRNLIKPGQVLKLP